MKSILKILLIALVITGCKESDSQDGKLTYDVVKDIPLLLKEGKHEVHIMDGVQLSPRVSEIQAKMDSAIKNNYEWFTEYVSNAKQGEILAYHENLGVTKEEYEEYVEGILTREAVSTGRESLTISKSNDVLTFKGTGKLMPFDFIRIDIKDKKVHYKEFTIPFEDTVSVTDTKGGLKSKWSGYSFLFSDPAIIDKAVLKDIANLDMTRLQLVVGRLEKNNHTVLDFSASTVVKGQKTSEIRLPLVFE